MSAPEPRLYGPRQIAIIAGAMLAGTAIFLYRRYHETGRIGRTEIIASVITLVIGAAIVVLIVRWANRRG